MKVILHPAVHLDLLEIMEYYADAVGVELAAEFYYEFRRSAGAIAARPRSFPIHDLELRRTNLERFPYHILFQISETSTIQILVVRHDRRHPSYGKDRH